MAQADKMRAKATKTVAAQNMARRAERLLAGLEAERVHDKVAKLRFPKPVAVRQDAAAGERPVALLRLAGGLHRRRPRHRPRLARSSCSASTAPARRPCCACSRASTRPTPARSSRATA